MLKPFAALFKDGFTSEFDGKEIKTEKGVFSIKPEDNVLTIAKINVKNCTAIIIGNAGTDNILVRHAEVGLNIVGFSGIGALSTGTIFSNTDSKGNYFFVTSRHTQLLGSPALSMPSQWTGFCKIIEQ